ncbi:MAG: hypothetical protein M3N15_05010, partial [Actinomycetota bacterium]|nr:hypothetical protein [Actinomycetota bacterium]
MIVRRREGSSRPRRQPVAVLAGAVLALVLASCGTGTGGRGEASLSRLIDPARELAVPVAPALAAEEVAVVEVAPLSEEPAEPPPPTAPPDTTPPLAGPTTGVVAAPVAARALSSPQPASAGLVAYSGLGTWIDAYDWSLTFGKDG